jgi:hypothetical protein
MAHNSLDLELLLIIPFSIGAAASLGMVQTDIFPIIDLGEVIFSTGNIELTAGRIMSILSLAAVAIHRDASILDTKGIDLWILYATIGMVLVPPFVPALSETLAQQPAAIIAFTVQSTGFAFISYTN